MLTNAVRNVPVNNLIEVRNLVKHFEVSRGLFSRNKKVIKAVDGIDFDIKAGETLGLVGQSGCGKTTTARSLCLLDPKTSGTVKFLIQTHKKWILLMSSMMMEYEYSEEICK